MKKILNQKPGCRTAELVSISLGMLVMLCGCAGPALHHTFGHYSEAYANSMNEQLLLNLARLSRNEPPYFIQLGQMNAQFTFKTGLGFTPSGTSIEDATKSGLTFGGSVTAEMTENPVFNFVPLNGEQFSQAINNPISEQLFYTLYDQGFHADILLRTVVASVRFRDTNDQQLVNILVNKPENPSYADFLRFADEMFAAQLSRTLLVEKTNSKPSITISDAKLADALQAIKDGFTLTNNMGTNVFVVTPKKEFVFALTTTNVGKLADADTLKKAKQFRDEFNNHKIEFQMRTFLSAMYATAKEASYFARRMTEAPNNDLQYASDAYGYIARSTNGTAFRPILTITGLERSARPELKTSAELNYRGTNYAIGDLEPVGEVEWKKIENTFTTSVSNNSFDTNDFRYALKHTDNRRVFSLLSVLFADVSIDPQKLPIQQLIQIH